jgi:hypothetical protein
MPRNKDTPPASHQGFRRVGFSLRPADRSNVIDLPALPKRERAN